MRLVSGLHRASHVYLNDPFGVNLIIPVSRHGSADGDLIPGFGGNVFHEVGGISRTRAFTRNYKPKLPQVGLI